MTGLTRLSLHNRALVALATILTLVAGLMSARSLKQELFPSIQFPVIATITAVPGADAEVVEQQVSGPVETAAQALDGVTGVRSTSSSGFSVVTAELDFGTDLEKAQLELDRAVAGLRGLPEGAEPRVIIGSFDDIPVITITASTPGDQKALLARLEETVIPRLEQIDGVREVQLTGTRRERVTIDLDQARAARAGVGPEAIAAALRSSGVIVPAGEITGDTSMAVQVGSPLRSAKDIERLPLQAGAAAAAPSPQGPGAPQPQARPTGASTVALGDIADVRVAPAPQTQDSRTDGVPSVTLGIIKTTDANTVAVSHAVQDAIAELRPGLGEDARLEAVIDQAPYIEKSIHDLTVEGLLGLAFAVLVVAVFLLSVRLTLVTAVSIPLSLLIALIGLRLGGYSLNILTLGALTIAVGRVVDDSIVVIENIKRHMDSGERRLGAIPRAVGEVAGAITASTLATVAVFLPLGLVGGQVGELFRPFAVTVTIALLASLLVALTIIPVLGYWLLREGRELTEAEAAALHEREDRPDRLQRAYLPGLRFSIRRPLVTLLMAGLVLAGTLGLATRLKTDFIGTGGDSTVVVTQRMPAGTPLEEGMRRVAQADTLLAGRPDIRTRVSTIGNAEGDAAASFSSTSQASTATWYLALADGADSAEVIEGLRADLAGREELGAFSVAGLSQDPSANTTKVIVEGRDPAALEQGAAAVAEALSSVEGAAEVTNDLAQTVPGVSVRVDRAKAARAGLTEAAVGQAVSAALRGATLGEVTIGEDPLQVVLRSGDAPASVKELKALPVGQRVVGGAPAPVRLADIATVSETDQAASIAHTDGERSGTVTTTHTGDDLSAFTREVTAAVDGADLPEGVTARIGGVSEEQSKAFAQLGLAMLAAIAIVYLIMVAAFRSIVQPLILLVSIPFAATGAIGMLLLTGTPLGVPAMIGMLMLVGIVVTNAIVLIDLVNQYRERGHGIDSAVLEGGRHRLRPIIMTALATIMALLPMAFALTGGGGFISQPLALVVIGGLVTSTLLTLLLVPALYVLVERAGQRRRQRRLA